MKVLRKLIQFGCNFVLPVMSLSVEFLLGDRGLREGGRKREKRRLGVGGNPGRVEYWWSRGINRLGWVTECRGRNKARPREGWRVGLRWRWVKGWSWVYWRERSRWWTSVELSRGVLSSTSKRPALPVSASPSARMVRP